MEMGTGQMLQNRILALELARSENSLNPLVLAHQVPCQIGNSLLLQCRILPIGHEKPEAWPQSVAVLLGKRITPRLAFGCVD